MKKQLGFSTVEVVIVIVVIGVLGFIGWMVLGKKDTKKSNPSDQTTASSSASPSATVAATEAPKSAIWRQTEGGWQAMETAPKCPKQPMAKMPTNTSLVTSVLYPGQTRGGNYKPHGGFRFDTTKDNVISVMAPFDGFLMRGGRYIAENEVQYTFDVMNNCGVLYRVGHLREIPANLQKIADTWPAPSASSATQSVNPALFIKQGDVLGTKVGLIKSNNTFFDFGIYDYRETNQASKSTAYQTAHSEGKELSWHAVCWLKDWLPAKDSAALLALPAGDPASGKTSDYCK